MTRQELIAQCRYYKGEEENPFEGVDQNKKMLWFYEQAWIFDMMRYYEAGNEREAFRNEIAEYNGYGLKDFCVSDGIPVTLKALLYNRYAKGSFSMADAAQHFKTFYRKYYA